MAAAARSTWSDSRLTDLKDTVASIDEKVARLDAKVDQGFARADKKTDAGFGRLDDRIDKLNHSLVQGMIALTSIITVLLSILVGIVATHL
jgi:hypothetical protein